jgi:superfamily II DNA or RNA helicase
LLIKELNNTYSIIETDDIEIKHYLIDILSVYLPGYKFMPSVKAGLSDGKKKFFRITPQGDLLIPSGLSELIQNKLDEKDYNYEVQKLPQEHNYHLTPQEADEFIKSCNLPFEPYWYQKEAFIDAINNKRKVMLMATSSGKSLVISLVLEYLRLKGLKTVLIVPNINLLEQFSSDILSYNLTELHKHVHLVGGENKIKHFDNNITITTWQSLNKMMELWKDIDCILIDETHGAKADVVAGIITAATETEYKLGFTGTLPELYIDKLTLLGSIGSHKEYITAKELVDNGLGTPIKVYALFLNYNQDEVKYVRKLKTYQKEVKYIEEHDRRNKFLSNFVQKIAKKHGNSLLLYNHNKHGEDLFFRITGVKLTNKLKNDYVKQAELGVFYVSGAVKGSVREKIRNLLENIDNAIVIANFSILSTGVNIKNLHTMIFASSSKSDVRIRQSLGRGLRKHDSKELFRVYDIVDDLTYFTKTGNAYPNYMIKHWEARNDTYQNNFFDVEEVEYNI